MFRCLCRFFSDDYLELTGVDCCLFALRADLALRRLFKMTFLTGGQIDVGFFYPFSSISLCLMKNTEEIVGRAATN